MNAYVVDTNVAIAANEINCPQASPTCVLKCVAALEEARNGIVCIDNFYHIMQEYMNNLSLAGQPGVGDFFMKWIFDNQGNPDHCEMVEVTPLNGNPKGFEEFPDDEGLADFDLSDRKFVVVALKSQYAPPILNATDSDWWHARDALNQVGVQVRFLCPEQFNE
ncbi:hypothetical protein LOC68_09620 [Blastopirellula sp. JC732]|uniref:Uncharacterized protein n=1 Tax=Blastopirellula sediminis TaxID=2894196 RepID=A0A9X1MKS0_9BACT|nr:hypothetical protein [Blastopirellula sediminis]MCC9608567.1 hypothetical protein [Blastopirellula sediminis]MCC9628656.1 hypothetical protein [Blastopirellula sediminis]